MPIAGGILVAGSAARCLSSAAGMLRFLARLSGRRRHVRRSCGPGGGCCAAAPRVQTGETRTAEMTTTATTTTTTTTATTTVASTAASVASELFTGGTTTMTSIRQDRLPRDSAANTSNNRVEDPSWFQSNIHQNSDRDSRYFEFSSAHDDRTHAHYLRRERTRYRTADCQNREDTKSQSEIRETTVDGEFCELRGDNERLSMKNFDDGIAMHRVEKIPDSRRSTRRQRLRITGECGSTTTTTRNEHREEWITRPDYVDLIVGERNREDAKRGTNERINSDDADTSFCHSRTRRSRIPPYLATLLIISYTLFGIADACSSRSTPKPRPPTVTSRPNITFHMYTCPPDYAEWYCLNGATCFTVKIQESLLYNCICFDGFIGQRCEFKDLDGSYLPSRQRVMLETASIAGGATIAVFLVVVICVAAYIHCKRKQKELRTSSTCVDTVDGPGRDPELRPFSNRSLMIFMAKNPNGATMCPSIEQTRMPGWNDYSPMESARMASVNEGKRGSSQ